MVILRLKKINVTAIKVLFLRDVDIEKILMSNKISFGIKKYKYFIGYLYDDYKIESLHIIFQKATIFVNNYDGQTKWMYFLIEGDDDDILFGVRFALILNNNLVADMSRIKILWKLK